MSLLSLENILTPFTDSPECMYSTLLQN